MGNRQESRQLRTMGPRRIYILPTLKARTDRRTRYSISMAQAGKRTRVCRMSEAWTTQRTRHQVFPKFASLVCVAETRVLPPNQEWQDVHGTRGRDAKIHRLLTGRGHRGWCWKTKELRRGWVLGVGSPQASRKSSCWFMRIRRELLDGGYNIVLNARRVAWYFQCGRLQSPPK